MSAPKTGLGKGLGALMQRTDPAPKAQEPGDEAAAETAASAKDTRPAAAPSVTPKQRTKRHDDEKDFVPMPAGVELLELPVTSIVPNPRQPRTAFDEDALNELVESIREVGVLQPVVVRRVGKGYELIMGERRWRATQAAGLTTIPAMVRQTSDDDLLRDALLENLHRAQLNPLEEAAAYQQLLEDFGCTQEELATRIKRSRPQISNTIRLLRLPGPVQRRVAAGVLSAGHARALLMVEDPLAQERLAQRIVAEGLSVRAVEEIVAMGDGTTPPKRTARGPKEPSPRAMELSSSLSDHFDTRVKVDIGRNKGRITIEFASEDDLERILNIVNAKEF